MLFWRLCRSFNDHRILKPIASDKFLDTQDMLKKEADISIYKDPYIKGVNTRALYLQDYHVSAFMEIIFWDRENKEEKTRFYKLIREKHQVTDLSKALTTTHCKSCGAPDGDLLNLFCAYCDTKHDTTAEWTLFDMSHPLNQDYLKAIRQS